LKSIGFNHHHHYPVRFIDLYLSRTRRNLFGLDLIRSTIKHYHVAAAHCSAIYTYLQYNQLISASKCQPVLLLRFGLSLIRLWV
ncbi:hypothetical protein M8J76_002052, partial [Diaphorina citri]